LTSGLVDESESDYDSNDIDYLRDLFGDVVESDDYEDEEEVTEEIIGNMMKTRIYCGSDDGEEIICVICQCEYENDETIGTLECQHEYHSSCIKEWLLKGKRSCPICRSSVLPSFDHIDDNNPNLRGDVYNQPTSEFPNYVASIKSKVEEFIGCMMKTRIHSATTDHDGGEICVICQCKYENDETIVALKCQHEYHNSCLKQWLLKGKRCCPICRSSVLP
ncbi:hypothetical protein H5410_011457, partial [Solanum commersonii]